MSRGGALAAVPAAERPALADQRAALMRSLTGRGTLGGEWDAERLLLVPRPGGRLTRTGPCPVAGCGRDRSGAGPLCGWHDRQFASSGRVSVEEWVAAGEPRLTQRRRLSQLACLVTGDDGTSCPRPGIGAAGLCHAHDQAWADARRAGEVVGGFLARAEPLAGFGGCAAACCYLQASYRKSRLCVVHYRMWCEQGRRRDGLRCLGSPGPPAGQRPGGQPAGPARTGPPGVALRHSGPGA